MKVSHSPLLFGGLLLASSPVGVSTPTRRNGPNCGLPLVQDQALQDSITAESLATHAKALEAIAYSTPGRNRLTGTEGFNLTVEYIKAQLDALDGYYKVEVQPWEGLAQGFANSTFSVNGQAIASLIVEFSPNGTLTDVPLVPVANVGCDASDFTPDVAGNIALIFRGSCTFALKAALARDAGAVAAVFYNNPANTGVVAGTFGDIEDAALPAAGITQADGEALVAAYNSGTVLLASLEVVSVLEALHSNNVIATSKYGDPNNILFLGAHADSVEEGPGINDDGSGTIGILETAIQLAKWRTKAKVKFGWWTAEEFGMKGSEYYISTLSDEELLKIRLYLNFDMIASPNYILGHYDGDGSEYGVGGPPGSAEAEHFFEEYYESLGLNHTATEFNRRSDYRDFFDAGIPCGGLDAGADEIKTQEWADMFGGTPGIILDPNYHSALDNFDNLNMTAFEIMSKGIGHAVAYYGKTNFEGFPARDTSQKRVLQASPTTPRGSSRPQEI